MRAIQIAAITLCVASSVQAKQSIDIQPIQIGNETARYVHGHATVDLLLTNGAVQVRPIPRINDNIRFAITIYNNGVMPSDFDISNIYVTASGVGVGLYTPGQYIAREKNRAMWGQIAVGLIGGLAAAASASQTTTYRSRYFTPHGNYTRVSCKPMVSPTIQAGR
jgi:hypothetical protein